MRIVLILFILCMAFTANAAEVTLAWDANAEEDLAGYKIFWGTASRDYAESVDVGNVVIYTLKDLPDDTFFFAATAYDNDDNESAYSNEVSVRIDTIPPGTVIMLPAKITDKTTYKITVEEIRE